MFVAEGVGFEPTRPGLASLPAFEAGPFNRSGTPPHHAKTSAQLYHIPLARKTRVDPPVHVIRKVSRNGRTRDRLTLTRLQSIVSSSLSDS